jgi:hypothetical protein
MDRCRLTRRLSLGRRAAATSLAHQLGLGLSSYLSPPSKRRSLARTEWSVSGDRQDFFPNPGNKSRPCSIERVMACLVVIGITVFPALLFAWFVLIEPRVQQRIMQRSRCR